MALLFDKGLWIILSNQDRIFGKMLFKCVIDIQLQYDGVKTDIWTADRSRTRTTTIDKQHHRGKGCFFCIWLRTVPLTLSSHYAVARWRFSLMTSSVLESRTWSVCAWTPQPVGGCLPWLDVSAGLQRSSFGLVDSVACEHLTSCSNSAMQYWAKHTCREGQSFLKRFPLKTADAMKLWNYETSVLWLWFNPILTLLLLYRAPVSCLQSPALSAVGLQTVNTAWRTETLVVLNNVQTFR